MSARNHPRRTRSRSPISVHRHPVGHVARLVSPTDAGPCQERLPASWQFPSFHFEGGFQRAEARSSPLPTEPQHVRVSAPSPTRLTSWRFRAFVVQLSSGPRFVRPPGCSVPDCTPLGAQESPRWHALNEHGIDLSATSSVTNPADGFGWRHSPDTFSLCCCLPRRVGVCTRMELSPRVWLKRAGRAHEGQPHHFNAHGSLGLHLREYVSVVLSPDRQGMG